MTLSATVLRPFSDWLPHLFYQASRLDRMQPSYCFRGATRYSLMTTGGIRTGLGSVPDHPSRGDLTTGSRWSDPRPFHLHAGIRTRSSYSHTTLAVLPDPLAARFRGAILEFAAPDPFCQSANQSTLGLGGLLPSPGLRSTTRPCLRAPMGGAWQRLRLSLLGWSRDIVVMYSGAPEPRIHERSKAIESRRLPTLSPGLLPRLS